MKIILVQPRHRETAQVIARLGWVTPTTLAGERIIARSSAVLILREMDALGLAKGQPGAEAQNPNYHLTAKGQDLVRAGWA